MSIYRGRTGKDFYLASLLYDSIEFRDLSSIKTLLSEKGADPNFILPKHEISPFHLAIGCDCSDFSLTVTGLILEHGGNPNVKSDDGLTPLHIAAAWGRFEILKLLLNLGGDPEIRDINGKTPLHYAYEEKYKECLELLKTYISYKEESQKEQEEDCDLILDKVLIQNGTTIDEYKVMNEMPSSIKSANLQSLPQPNNTELIINWFNTNHIETTPPIDIPKSTGSATSFDSFESSVDESENERSQRIDLESITFRKAYTKKRKISSEKKSPPVFDEADVTVVSETTQYVDALDDTKMLEFSKESGILTLPNSTSVDYSILFERGSDYLTCSTATENSNGVFERNIFEITEDLSVSPETRPVPIEQDGNLTQDLTFISVSEVYKYMDKEEGIVLFERRFLKSPSSSDYNNSLKSSSFSSKMSSIPKTIDYDTEALRKDLTSLGFNPGPITDTTKRVYIKKLRQLQKLPQTINTTATIKKVYTIELEKTLREPNWKNDLSDYKPLEEILVNQFNNPDPTRKWREGLNKSSFTYLLLDPRVTQNLPCRVDLLEAKDVWEIFLSSIFYIGKGKRSRPYQHLYQAVTLWNKQESAADNKKLQHILDIWQSDSGVICLHVFQNIIPVEAYTREAAMISALKVENLRNAKQGDFYGVAATWPQKKKKMLGVYLLHKAMMIFLQEGERQLCPKDID